MPHSKYNQSKTKKSKEKPDRKTFTEQILFTHCVCVALTIHGLPYSNDTDNPINKEPRQSLYIVHLFSSPEQNSSLTMRSHKGVSDMPIEAPSQTMQSTQDTIKKMKPHLQSVSACFCVSTHAAASFYVLYKCSTFWRSSCRLMISETLPAVCKSQAQVNVEPFIITSIFSFI